MDAIGLIERARHAGLDVTVDGGRLVVRGPRRAEELARAVLASRAEVMAELGRRGDGEEVPALGDDCRPSVERCPDCNEFDFVRPRAGGAWRCARCRPYDLPGEEVEWWPRLGPIVAFGEGEAPHEREPGVCFVCGGGTRWRLRTGGPWICTTCHPAQPHPDAIETEAAS